VTTSPDDTVPEETAEVVATSPDDAVPEETTEVLATSPDDAVPEEKSAANCVESDTVSETPPITTPADTTTDNVVMLNCTNCVPKTTHFLYFFSICVNLDI